MSLLKKTASAIAESITIAPIVIICAVLSIPLVEHKNDISFLLPVIITYATMKIGVLFLMETVDIVSPYKLLLSCISLTLLGSIVLLFAYDSHGSLYFVGSIISGLGLAPFSSLYKQYLLPPEYSDLPHFKSTQFISFIICLSIAFGCILSKQLQSRFMFYVWAVYILIIWLFIFIICKDLIYKESSTIITLKSDWLRKMPPLITLFIMIVATNGYKRSVSPVLFSVVLVLFIFCIVWYKRNAFGKIKKHCLSSVWLGAVWGFIIFYCTVYLTDTYMKDAIFQFYIIVIISSFFPPVLQFLFRNMSKIKALKISIIFTLTGLVLILSQNTVMFLFGVFLSTLFTSYAKSLNLNWYYMDNPHEFKINHDGHCYLGSGIIQSFTMIVFSAVCLIFQRNRHEIMMEFINPTGLKENGFILISSGIICILTLILLLIKISAVEKK